MPLTAKRPGAGLAWFLAVGGTLLPWVGAAHAQPWLRGERPGAAYTVTRTVKSAEKTSDGSSTSSSNDRDTLVERVLKVGADGLELEYGLPRRATADDRAGAWQFPARVFKPADGPLRLLNGPELEARVDAWLKQADVPRTACGRWIMTWNAFRIECDPQSVLATLGNLDLRPGELGDGTAYKDPDAAGPVRLRRVSSGPRGATFAGEAPIDPELVRRGQAESDLAVAEMSGKPQTLDEAMRAHAEERISGTVAVTFETDAAGHVRKRTRTTKVEVTGPDGKVDTRLAEETVERRPAPGR